MPDNRPMALNSAEFDRTVFSHTLPVSGDWRDALDPQYWLHVGYKLRDGDRIEVRSHDLRVQFEVLVLSVNHRTDPMHMEAAYRAIYPADLDLPKPQIGGGARYRVRTMRGSANQYEVVDDQSSQVVRHGLHRHQALDVAAALQLGNDTELAQEAASKAAA